MRHTKTKNWMVRAGVLVAVAGVVVFAACTASGPPRPTCETVSDAGTLDGTAIVPYTAVTTDAQPIEALGMESDPGAQCTDCRQDDAYEIMAVSDFEDGFAPAWFNYGEPGIFIEPKQAGEAIDDAGMTVRGKNPPQPWWGLQVTTLGDTPGGERCGSKYALHLQGSRFSSWGGGYVTRHFIVRGDYMTKCVGNQCFCQTPRPERPPLIADRVGDAPCFMPDCQPMRPEEATGCMFWASPVVEQPSLLGVNVSDFDGLSFWARRGPSGQATLRVSLVDSSVSEDLALYKERVYYKGEKLKDPDAVVDVDQAGASCTRIKGCCRGCSPIEYSMYVPETGPDGGPPVDGGSMNVPAHCEPATEKRCHVEGERVPYCRENPDTGAVQMFDHRVSGCGLAPDPDAPVVANDPCWATPPDQIANLWDDDYPLCCPPTMADENPREMNGDPRYGGTECKPYIFNYDQSSGNYCYAEGELLPEKNQNRCGEGFEGSVVVDTEWKLYTIPWAELRRYTPDKPPLDPQRIWQIAFYFSSGFLDTYIDDVGFYRRRK